MLTPIQALKVEIPKIKMVTVNRWLKWSTEDKRYHVYDYSKARVVCRAKHISVALEFLLEKR